MHDLTVLQTTILRLSDVDLGTQVGVRVYEKHFLTDKRVGSLEYTVSTVVDQSETRLEFIPEQFTAVLSFPTREAAEQAPAAGLAEAQAKKTERRLFDRLGPTRDAFKTILDFGGAVAELHPAAKMAFGISCFRLLSVSRWPRSRLSCGIQLQK
ncbi:hypothetical protein BDV93DRAFT_366973 [Ceratobasidium sp. AG-I]|nr:hypothetical protein BDV93DRAFT_366973 [Ceratobasidium sp. AG-I]